MHNQSQPQSQEGAAGANQAGHDGHPMEAAAYPPSETLLGSLLWIAPPLTLVAMLALAAL